MSANQSIQRTNDGVRFPPLTAKEKTGSVTQTAAHTMEDAVGTDKAAMFGVLCWEPHEQSSSSEDNTASSPSDELSDDTTKPRGFWAQLEAMPGNIMNEKAFSFPVVRERVPGANFETVVQNVTPHVRESFVSVARRMEAEGASAITTSCGFNCIYQNDLASAVTIPVFTSSLLQVTLAKAIVGPSGEVGVITADSDKLSKEHLRACGVTDDHSVRVAGIENTGEFLKRNEDEPVVDPDKFIAEVVETTENLCKRYPRIRAIVLECTDLPPCSEAIRKRLRLPVFDILTLANYVHSAVGDCMDGEPNVSKQQRAEN